MLEVQNLSFAYTGKPVLDSIGFSVMDHDICAILGRNAVGKTTLTNILSGVLTPQCGTISIDGEEISSTVCPFYFGAMRPLTELFQKMTVFEYLSLIATFYNVPGSLIGNRIQEYAERFSFTEHLYKKISKCSLGTQKKVMFVAAILHKPRFVILDEPFDSLDPVVCYEMKSYLREYAATEGTVLVTSHALDLVQHFCSHYLILNNCKIVAQGSLGGAEPPLEQVFLEAVGGEINED